MYSGFSTRLNVEGGDEGNRHAPTGGIHPSAQARAIAEKAGMRAQCSAKSVGWWMRSASPLGKLSPQATEGVSTSSDA